MFAVVKDVDLGADRLCGNEEGVLGHVPRSVDLPIVVDGLQDVHLSVERRFLQGIAPLHWMATRHGSLVN